MFHGVLDVWGRRGGVSWVLDVGGVFTVAAGAGVIISHYPQGRRLCSPVTSGFIELAALHCLFSLCVLYCPEENIPNSTNIRQVPTV